MTKKEKIFNYKKMASDHTGIRNGQLFCFNCGESQEIPNRISVELFAEFTKSFSKIHKKCPQTWKQPEVDQNKNILDKMYFWLNHGERGISSETMFEILGNTNLDVRYRIHPIDPDDFRRCYLLLETIPEWKGDLDKLRNLSPVWSNLVDNWNKLTEMLKEQMQTKKANGMYEFMKSLGC
jgi:hypothetical protein